MTEFNLPFQDELFDAVKFGFEETEQGGNSVGILLLGESGSGKTHAADLLAKSHKQYKAGNQIVTPCLRINVSAIGGNDSIPNAALAQLGRPIYTRMPNIELVLIDALITHRVRLIILEEFHNRLLSSKREFRHTQGELLKNLWNFISPETTQAWAKPSFESSPRKPVIVISGLPNLLNAFEIDSELGSRFPTRIFANRLAIFPDSDFKDFRRIIKQMSKRFALDDLVDPNDNSFAARCFFASAQRGTNGRLGCHLRDLEVIFQRAATLRRRTASSTATGALFENSFKQVGSPTACNGNPFSFTENQIGKLTADEKKRHEAISRR